MYIQPQTNIKLLTDVPLDTTFRHTILFSSSSAQYNYFAGKQKKGWSNYTYQRVNKGKMRVSATSDDIYDVNYLMFQNTSFGSKWFYAFVTAVEYVNNETSEITFEIDPIQTWWFDFEFQGCFIERQHEQYDDLFGNLEPENVELGDYHIFTAETKSMSPLYLCALTSQTSDGSAPTGKTINNIYVPLNVIAGVPVSDASSINGLLEEFVGAGQEDAIVTLYEYPGWLGDANTTKPKTQEFTVDIDFNTIDGYTPKNKKLFTYPYNYMMVSNSNGEVCNFKYELWNNSGNVGDFEMTGVFVSTPCVLLYPRNYRGVANDYDSGITMSNFPQVPWVGDTYKAWMAQNKGSIVTSTLTSVISSAGMIGASLAVPATTPLAIGSAAMNVGSTVANNVGTAVDKQNTPAQVHGQIQCDSLNAGMNRFNYVFYRCQINAQVARSVDDYFSMYGYAINRVMVPNITSRPYWNYLKTRHCTLTGSVPADDMRKLCQIFDNGITFWHDGNNVGNYNLDNSPT